MSGRLVILPHKSWHVWNQDNREKVLKDERINNEKQQLKLKNEQNLISEFNYELLTKSEQLLTNNNKNTNNTIHNNIADTSVDDEIIIDNEQLIVEQDIKPFRLFDDLEKKYNQQQQYTNDEYMKEKLLKDKKQKQRDGIDPWALGDGSYEFKKTKPWWHSTTTVIKTENTTIKTENENDYSNNIEMVTNSNTKYHYREIDRKIQADPMSKLLKIDQYPYNNAITVSSTSLINKTSDIHNIIGKLENNNNITVQTIDNSDGTDTTTLYNPLNSSNNSNIVQAHHIVLESKSNKKHKKHKHNKTASSNNTNNIQTTTCSSTTTTANTTNTGNNNDIWNELRKKRVERESSERKKSIILLTHQDIYGTNTNSNNKSIYESYNYGQQYNPHLAKK